MMHQLINPTVKSVSVSVHTDSVIIELSSCDNEKERFGLRFGEPMKMAWFVSELVKAVMDQCQKVQEEQDGTAPKV